MRRQRLVDYSAKRSARHARGVGLSIISAIRIPSEIGITGGGPIPPPNRQEGPHGPQHRKPKNRSAAVGLGAQRAARASRWRVRNRCRSTGGSPRLGVARYDGHWPAEASAKAGALGCLDPSLDRSATCARECARTEDCACECAVTEDARISMRTDDGHACLEESRVSKFCARIVNLSFAASTNDSLFALLFDIVNVQNWPAALRSARSVSPVANPTLPSFEGQEEGRAPLTILSFFCRLSSDGRAPPS